MNLEAVVLVLYVFGLFAFGVLKAGRIRTQADFAVAGRGLSTRVLIGTLLATWIGTGTIFGSAERTYEVGIAFWFYPLSSVLGIIVLSTLAKRIRRIEGFTVQDILERRFGPAARVLGTVAVVLAYVTILSYQFRAAGLVLQLAVPDVDYELAVGISAVAIVVYTAIAGLKSVAHTDVVNGFFMVVGILALIPALFFEVGGFEGIAEALPAEKRDLWGPVSPLEIAGVLLPGFLLMLGDANMYQRFFAAKDEASAQRAARWLVLGILVMEGGVVIAAWLGSAIAPGLDDPARVIPLVGLEVLPPLAGALLLAVVLAVIVSTADSFLLVAGTCIVRDVYQRFFDREASETRLVGASRGAVLVLGVWAWAQSLASDEFLSVALYAYTIYGAGITPSILAALLWSRATRAGSIASIASGTAVTLWWELAGLAASTGVDAVIPAIAVSGTALVGVSLATGRRP